MTPQGIALIVSAPSGTGKTTVCARLRKTCPDIHFKVSHTTRAPREKEVNGTDYHFISEEEFLKLRDEGEFLEWAQVHKNYYATSRTVVENHIKNGEDLLMELDVQGVESLRNLNFDGVFVLILPPSLEELEKRLKGRGTESPEKIAGRIETGKQEITRYAMYDYVITNHTVDQTVKTLRHIIKAEQNRSGRYVPPSPDIQALLEGAVNP